MGIASAERLRYLRRLYVWPLPISLPLLAFAVAADWGSWWLVLVGIGAVCWVRGFASLGRQIRDGRAASADKPARVSRHPLVSGLCFLQRLSREDAHELREDS